MNTCSECGEKETMYKANDQWKCCKCGWSPDFNTNLMNSFPTREETASCGDIITSTFDGVSRAATRKATCKDGSMCSIKPSGIKEEGNAHMVVCTFHQD